MDIYKTEDVVFRLTGIDVKKNGDQIDKYELLYKWFGENKY